MWEVLKEGDLIDVVAPSGKKVTQEEIDKAIKCIEDKGYRVRIDKDVIGGDVPYHANTDEYRSLQMNKALNAEDSKAVWCLRGGYGAARIVEKLQKPAKEKIFIGFSDITALHLYVNQQWGWKPIHGDVVTRFIRSNVNHDNFTHLFKLISGEEEGLSFPKLKVLSKKGGKDAVEGEIVGGNLAMIQTSIGTSWELNSKDKIVFLEDIEEKGYSVDRMLEHLKQAKVLEGAKAIVFGEFTGGDEDDGSNHIDYALQRFAEAQDIPVLQTSYIGHGSSNFPIIIGGKAKLSLGEEVAFEVFS